MRKDIILVFGQETEPGLTQSIPLHAFIDESLKNSKDSKRSFFAEKHVTEKLRKCKFICKIKFAGFYKEEVFVHDKLQRVADSGNL